MTHDAGVPLSDTPHYPVLAIRLLAAAGTSRTSVELPYILGGTTRRFGSRNRLSDPTTIRNCPSRGLYSDCGCRRCPSRVVVVIVLSRAAGRVPLSQDHPTEDQSGRDDRATFHTKHDPLGKWVRYEGSYEIAAACDGNRGQDDRPEQVTIALVLGHVVLGVVLHVAEDGAHGPVGHAGACQHQEEMLKALGHGRKPIGHDRRDHSGDPASAVKVVDVADDAVQTIPAVDRCGCIVARSPDRSHDRRSEQDTNQDHVGADGGRNERCGKHDDAQTDQQRCDDFPHSGGIPPFLGCRTQISCSTT